jgi:YesN/AraC family two-component response regulator
MKKKTIDISNTPDFHKEVVKIVALTEKEISEYSAEEVSTIFDKITLLIAEEEKIGQTTWADDLREKLYTVCKYINIVGGSEDLKRQDWNNHHSLITNYIYKYLVVENYGHLPSIKSIANETGLSRQTIHKHLSAGIGNTFHQERLKTFEYLSSSIFSKLYKLAIQGNVTACRIYLENIYKPTQTPAQNIKQQNNFLQINNTRIDEIVINELPEGARQQIENIVMQYTKKTA